MSTSNVWQVTGPPGTGKTTFLAQQAEQAVEEFGGKKVVIASLTRAAAYEFAKRRLSSIPPDQIGTLHMICRRALDNPSLTEGKEKDWNAYAAAHHARRFELTPGRSGPVGVDRNRELTTVGEHCQNKLNLLRNRHPLALCDGHQVPGDFYFDTTLTRFHELWEAWKGESDLMDFTDLLEQCLLTIERAPGNPEVMYGDEVQDWSALEIQLFRDKWGCSASKVMLMGDVDQTIYAWRGADPRIFLDHPVPPEQKILLSQSYRVPSTVRDCALAWISSKVRDREPVEYKARQGAIGGVWRQDSTFRQPRRLVDRLELAYQEKNDDTWMILASCDYMLRPLLKELKARGIPYANPYRAGDKSWNPLRWGEKGHLQKRPEVTRLDVLLDFLAPSAELRGDQGHEWTWSQIKRWCAPLRATGDDAVLARGAKADLARLAAKEEIAGAPAMGTFNSLFRDPHHLPAGAMNLDWWFDSMLPKKALEYAYFRKIIEHFGQRALVEKPRIWPGTIHSAKGGEATHVVVFPDLSPSAHKLWWTGGKEAIARLFYVAMTRAQEHLYICEPSGPNHCELNRACAPFIARQKKLTSEACEVPF